MSETKTKADGYNHVVQQATLLDISLTASSFRAEPDIRDHIEEAGKFVSQTIMGAPHYDQENNILAGQVRCRVYLSTPGSPEVSDQDEGFAKAILAIEATYAAFFQIPGEHDDDTLNTFFGRMGMFSTWPYFRTHVATVAAEAGIEMPILPIKKLFHPVRSAGGYSDPPLEEIES